MRNVAIALPLTLLLTIACAGGQPSEESIQTAIAQTEAVATKSPTEKPPTKTPNFAATNAVATQVKQDAEATRQASSNSAVVRSTAQARSIFDHIERMVEDGYLDTDGGVSYELEDFSATWAQLGWYEWTNTGRSPDELVIRADASWESASDKADWWASGCGFVFGEQDNSNHYVAYLGLDGWAYLSEIRDGNWIDLGSSYFGHVDTPAGGANLMLLVAKERILFFVNDELVITRQVADRIQGNLALTLLSGTNKDFGTRCEMTNIELWEVGDILLPVEDDFSDPDSGWRTWEAEEGGVAKYAGGIYSILDTGGKYAMTGTANMNFVNVAIEVDAILVTDNLPSEAFYGVACRIQPNFDGYYFYIRSDGEYQIFKWSGGSSDLLASGRNTASIYQGAETNSLKAICDGSYLALYANGDLLDEAFDDGFFYGDIAFAVDSSGENDVEVHFDNLVVEEPN